MTGSRSSATMDGMLYTLSSPDILHARLSDSATGTTVYYIDTPQGVSTNCETHIRRSDDPDQQPIVIATISWWSSGSGCDAQVKVHGRDVTPSSSSCKGLLSKSESFIASDGGEYKWKVTGLNSPPYLVDQTFFDTVASYTQVNRRRSFMMKRSTLGRLHIGSECSDIADEVVATFVYMERKRQRQKMLGFA
ncbi:hypothetical protein BDV98DRAFT_565801 [Pterulicium gracile]|uniref:DUF6593 domain-containing protein n=1 Tax=Pterulicium gracile TaxID=1884261 RepID=A0A5C3QKJ8_9AGAR|nr:hypothetical protein BDV98DRAFT_565801 [Pterula gracilis]